MSFISNTQKFLEIRHNSWFDSSKSTSNTNFPANIDEVFKRKQYKNTQKNLKKKKKIPNDFVWDILSFQLAIFSASLSLPPTLRNWPHGTDLQPLVQSFCIWPSGGGRIGVSWSGEVPQQMKIFFSTSPNPLPAVLARRPKSLFDRICLFYPKKILLLFTYLEWLFLLVLLLLMMF